MTQDAPVVHVGLSARELDVLADVVSEAAECDDWSDQARACLAPLGRRLVAAWNDLPRDVRQEAWETRL